MRKLEDYHPKTEAMKATERAKNYALEMEEAQREAAKLRKSNDKLEKKCKKLEKQLKVLKPENIISTQETVSVQKAIKFASEIVSECEMVEAIVAKCSDTPELVNRYLKGVMTVIAARAADIEAELKFADKENKQ